MNNTINSKNNTINNLIGKSAGRALFLRLIPWHLPYNWGKSTEKPQWGYPKRASWDDENRIYRTEHKYTQQNIEYTEQNTQYTEQNIEYTEQNIECTEQNIECTKP